MTEFSFPWGCDPTGDGGSGSFSLDIVEDTNKFLSNYDPTLEGVIHWTQAPHTGDLGATNPAGNTVRIATGVGMVEGWLYTNDANVDFNVGGGNANATDLIVLRRSNPGVLPQTVRLALVRGPAAGVATVTQTASVWEVALWQVVLDGAGNFSSLNDVRAYINARWCTEWMPVLGGKDFTTPVELNNAGAINMYASVLSKAWGNWRVPQHFIRDLTSTPICRVIYIGAAPDQIYIRDAHDFATCGETYNIHSNNSGWVTYVPGASNLQHCLTPLSIAHTQANIDDLFWGEFQRDGTHANDTDSQLIEFSGWEMKFLGYKR